MTPIVVWPDKFVSGWAGGEPDLKVARQFPVVDLGAALVARHETDAHFVPYVVRDAQGQQAPSLPRLNKDALPWLREHGLRVELSAIVVDLDDPVAHAEKTAARSDWRRAMRQRLEQLPSELASGMAWYETRGGMRVLWLLEPALEPEPYLELLAALRAELARHGIEADPLKDWNRCYRLPLVTRDGGREERPHDWSRLGPLVWRPTAGAAPEIDPSARCAELPAGIFDGIATAGERFRLPDRIPEGNGTRRSPGTPANFGSKDSPRPSCTPH